MDLLQSDKVKSQLQALENKLSSTPATPDPIENAVKEFCDLLVTNASMCLKLVKRKSKDLSKKSKPKNNSWYDDECFALKRKLRLSAKSLLKQPNNPFIRGNFHTAKKAYRKMLKCRKRDFEKNAIDKLLSLSSNPK